MSQRHFEKDEFPRRCDHCPAPLVAGTRYRKVLAVLDSGDSFVGGDAALVEESFELVYCSRCFERLSSWLRSPLAALPAEGDEPLELDDEELADELEKELFILGDGEEGSAQRAAAGCRLQATGSPPQSPRKDSGDPGSEGEEADSRQQTAPEGTRGRGDCPTCSGCYGAHTPDCPSYRDPDPDPERTLAEWKGKPSLPQPLAPSPSPPCKHHPDKMHGAGDQFGGSDYIDDVDIGPWRDT